MPIASSMGGGLILFLIQVVGWRRAARQGLHIWWQAAAGRWQLMTLIVVVDEGVLGGGRAIHYLGRVEREKEEMVLCSHLFSWLR